MEAVRRVPLPDVQDRPAGGHSLARRACGRTPEEQDEITRRVEIYARQFERTGRFEWLPRAGGV